MKNMKSMKKLDLFYFRGRMGAVVAPDPPHGPRLLKIPAKVTAVQLLSPQESPV